MEDRLITEMIFISGIVLLGIEFTLFLITLFFNANLALKILSMIGACHIGGRLAFIGTGFELELNAFPIIIVIILYNTAYLFVVYSLFVLFSERVIKIKFIKSLHKKVRNTKHFRSNWNLLSIAIFIWIPLPLTGAVIGSVIAFLEGYQNKQVLLVAIPSMWIGVISWTLAFDELYQIVKMINPSATVVLTFFLLGIPFAYNLIRKKHKDLTIK